MQKTFFDQTLTTSELLPSFTYGLSLDGLKILGQSPLIIDINLHTQELLHLSQHFALVFFTKYSTHAVSYSFILCIRCESQDMKHISTPYTPTLKWQCAKNDMWHIGYHNIDTYTSCDQSLHLAMQNCIYLQTALQTMMDH